MTNGYVLSRLIENFMSPTLVNYTDFHDEFILAAFDKYVSHLIGEIMNLHFMLLEISGQSAQEESDVTKLTESNEEPKKMEEKSPEKVNEKPKEIL